MPSTAVTEKMPRPAREVFDLLHDYSRRLEWDTLLCEARLIHGYEQAQKGAVSRCVGRHFSGAIAVEAVYVSFKPGELAAVEMINRAPFFERFAASLRHHDVEGGGSELTYKVHFLARPRLLRWLLHPVMRIVLRHETKKRLRSLAAFLQEGRL